MAEFTSSTSRGGMVAIWTDGGYTIIELISDDDIEVGDTMQWANETGMGARTTRTSLKGK
jgi:hypothetical protein